MPEHTPGDWSVKHWPKSGPNGWESWEICHGSIGESVCERVYTEADANLMAAAPDLLAACEDIVTLTYGPENLTSVRVLKLARAAITKSKGETNA